MRLDLTATVGNDEMGSITQGHDEHHVQTDNAMASRTWTAHPQTLRLSTRPRPPLNPDGTHSRMFNRISKSTNMPTFVFNFNQSVDILAERMVSQTLIPLFRKLHPEKSGWNLSLVNLCATKMSLVASDTKDGTGRDIGRMFKNQEDLLRVWKVNDVEIAPSGGGKDHQREEGNGQEAEEAGLAQEQTEQLPSLGSENPHGINQETVEGDDVWDSDVEVQDIGDFCKICGRVMPTYAMLAHERFHDLLE